MMTIANVFRRIALAHDLLPAGAGAERQDDPPRPKAEEAETADTPARQRVADAVN